MQASDRVLAWRYGKALFQAAEGKGQDGKLQAELSAAHGGLLDCQKLLHHPRVPAAEKKKQLALRLSGKVSPVVLRFLELLIDKKRFDLLPMVAVDVTKLVAEKNHLAKAHVRTARPLSADAQQKLKDKLKNFAGKNIELDIKEDPELIGGLIVRLGDWVLDSSLRGQLKGMREALSNGN